MLKSRNSACFSAGTKLSGLFRGDVCFILMSQKNRTQQEAWNGELIYS